MSSSIKDHSVVNNIMFAPQVPPPYEPGPELFYIGAEEHSICCCLITANGRYLMEHDVLSSNHPVIVFCHGNAGNIGTTKDFARSLARATECHVLFFDYPGYGLSPGKSNETSACLAVRAVINHVLHQMCIPASMCILFGQSIGTGIAAYGTKYAVNHYAAILGGLILMSPYLSIKQLAQSMTSFGSCILDRLDTSANITYCQSPLLIIHGRQDRLIPVTHGESLLELATCPKFSWFPDDADHNRFDFEQLNHEVTIFIQDNVDVEFTLHNYHNITPRYPEATPNVQESSVIKSILATSAELTSGSVQSTCSSSSGSGCYIL